MMYRCAGETALIQSIFPPFPLPNYAPNFTLYDEVTKILKLNWTKTYLDSGQMPREAIFSVGELTLSKTLNTLFIKKMSAR